VSRSIKQPAEIWKLTFVTSSINIGNARIQGLEADLNMHGSDYNIALFTFFILYILLEVRNHWSPCWPEQGVHILYLPRPYLSANDETGALQLGPEAGSPVHLHPNDNVVLGYRHNLPGCHSKLRWSCGLSCRHWRVGR